MRYRHRSLFAMLSLPAILVGSALDAQDKRPATRLADAPPGSVRLFVSGGMRAPVLAMVEQMRAATGHDIVIESSESKTLQSEIEAGQSFEAALLTTSAIDDMTAKGKIVAGSAARVAVVRIGVSIRGTPPSTLDVTTPDGLKAAILGAHSIRRYYGVAASTPIVDRLFAGLGLTDSTKDKMVPLGVGPVPAEEPLAAGQYELVINLASAIIPMKGWTYAGLIPEQFQTPLQHSVGIGVGGDQALGRKAIAVFQSPAFDAALKANGIQRR